MAVSRPRSIPASKFRSAVTLAGDIDGINTTFSTPDLFRQVPPFFSIAVFYNGQRLIVSDDYLVSESSGAETGHDTVNLLFAPLPGDKLIADYIVL
jgi:hypothetical protein